ncbi:MAG: heavy metal-binding domain-containing protein [Blastocatellia bacterium]
MKIHTRASAAAIFAAIILCLLPGFPGAGQTPPQTEEPRQVVYVCPLHSDVSSKVPGKCHKCSTTLVASTGQMPDEYFACPMHPEETAARKGQCPKCRMALVKMSKPIPDEFQIRMTSAPRLIRPGLKTKLRFTITNPKTGEQAQKFNLMHEMPFHLFVISQDFAHFAHIHPDKQPDGSFTITTVFPQAGLYHIFCDLFPDGGMPQVISQTVTTAGFHGDIIGSRARLTPDKSLTRVVDGIRFELKLDPEAPTAGREAVLKYHLTDAATGKPVANLRPYLGAWGHTLILSEDAADYLHSHPTEMIPEGVDRSSLTSKAEVDFDTFFPRPGNYRIWSQFLRGDKLTTVSFNVHVPRMN